MAGPDEIKNVWPTLREEVMSVEDDAFKRRENPPYWWPDFNALLQLIQTVAIISMVGYILHTLLESKITIEQGVRDLLMVIIGVILACFKDVYGFTFGSSAGQKKQGEVITKSLETKDKIIAQATTDAATLAAEIATVTPSAVAPIVPPIVPPPAETKIEVEVMEVKTEDMNVSTNNPIKEAKK